MDDRTVDIRCSKCRQSLVRIKRGNANGKYLNIDGLSVVDGKTKGRCKCGNWVDLPLIYVDSSR